ncbi:MULTISPECIES: hypothetical protein [Dehalococcoides]|uniref:hypothetical protein n=1 Tax=Dehalococcoides TaxID=61434 RepID=UPI0005B563BD|nr:MULTISPECIES: hypothetical protein [Dehalococcoides]QYY57971.1 hypothetical protein CWV2_001274 [Dehalococcoides mccartyi]BAQ34753.1 hypothetical protein UCH007_07950 [Dehalococcoides sp. UCH007]
MGGPRLQPIAEEILIKIWMNLCKQGPEPSAKEVLASTERFLKDQGRNDIFLPKLRKVQNILSEARAKNEGLPPHEKQYQKPWNMATLNEYPIPSETLQAVAMTWRFALINGEPFTIRQAKWASRLTVFKFVSDATKLLLLSYEYAKREEASLISSTTFDSFNSDLRLVFSGVEYATIWKQLHGDKPFPDPFFTSIPYADDGGVMHEALHPVEYYNALYNGTLKNERDLELHAMVAKMPSFDTLGLFSNEIRVLYLMWLNFIKQKPEWQRITAEQAADVIRKLKDWSVEVQSFKYDPKHPPQVQGFVVEENEVKISPDLPSPNKVLDLLAEYSKGAIRK